ncbi:MAG TPA: hypothetical protein DCY13_10570 [Verrucomicrobiales bacterium]|nr:hypothetical protein [Verrucomicrobiales bacterium]
MKALVDASVVLAALIKQHPANAAARAWLKNSEPVLCPIVELAWIRVASKTYGASIEDAVNHLRRFPWAGWVPCDLSVSDGLIAPTPDKTTDWYLADLAKKHGMKWATLDKRANHPNAELV